MQERHTEREKDSKEQEYSIPDPETGYRIKVTKEQYEGYVRSWEIARSRFSKDINTPIIMTGTAGELHGDWSKLFKEMYGKQDK